ncbi:hypothetical protein [Oryzicola mucosus]|nr:hypothetical protein [Oryzicola mucosus]
MKRRMVADLLDAMKVAQITQNFFLIYLIGMALLEAERVLKDGG